MMINVILWTGVALLMIGALLCHRNQFRPIKHMALAFAFVLGGGLLLLVGTAMIEVANTAVGH